MTATTIAANLVGISRKKELNHQESEILKRAAKKIQGLEKHVGQLLLEVEDLREHNARLEERIGIMEEDRYTENDAENLWNMNGG